MPTQVQFRRGSSAQVQGFTGAAGELVVDTTRNTVVVQDGVTAGGHALAPNTAFNVANLSFDKANNALPNTSGAIFNGNLRISENLSFGTTSTDGMIHIRSDDVNWGNNIVSGRVDHPAILVEAPGGRSNVVNGGALIGFAPEGGKMIYEPSGTPGNTKSWGYVGFASGLANTMHIWNSTNNSIIFGTNNRPNMTLEANGSLYVQNNLYINGGQITPALTASLSYYVNPVTGSDTNDGSSGTPFRTINKALDRVLDFNMNDYTVTIYLADGIYYGGGAAGAPMIMKELNGSGLVQIIGNEANPENVVVYSNAGTCASASGGPYALYGLTLDCPTYYAPGNDTGYSLSIGSGRVVLSNVAFANGAYAHIGIGDGGRVDLVNRHIIKEGLTGTFTPGTSSPGGGVAGHIIVYGGGLLITSVGDTYPNQSGSVTVEVTKPISTMGYFLNCYNGEIIWQPISVPGLANVTSTTKYSVSMNGIINARGNAATWIPGDSPGVSATGGQFI